MPARASHVHYESNQRLAAAAGVPQVVKVDLVSILCCNSPMLSRGRGRAKSLVAECLAHALDAMRDGTGKDHGTGLSRVQCQSGPAGFGQR